MEYFYEDKDMIKLCERSEKFEKAWIIFFLIFVLIGVIFSSEYLLLLFIYPIPICFLLALKEGKSKRIYPTNKVTLAISSTGIVLRGKRYTWKDIKSIKIKNTGSYRNRPFIRPNFKLFCQCAYFRMKKKVEVLDLGYNFSNNDKKRIIQLLQKYCKNVDIQ